MLSAPKDSDVILPLVTSLRFGLDSIIVAEDLSGRRGVGPWGVCCGAKAARHRGMMGIGMAPDALVGCSFFSAARYMY